MESPTDTIKNISNSSRRVNDKLPLDYTRVTYSTLDYDILKNKDDQNMQFELLTSIREREIPYDFIIESMKQNNMDERIINTYLRKTWTQWSL